MDLITRSTLKMIEGKIEEINILKNQIFSLRTDKDWDDAFLEKVKVDFIYTL